MTTSRKLNERIGICLFVVVLILGGVLPVAAQPPTVVYIDDDAPNDPGPYNPNVSDPLENGSLEHPFDSIAEAVYRYGDWWPIDEIVVYPGRYDDQLIRFEHNQKYILRSTDGAEVTIIEPGIRFSTSAQAVVEIIGFTITGSGPGLENRSSEVTVRNCIFKRNSCGITSYVATMIVANCSFIENAEHGIGGSLTEVSSCTFIGNNGGGIGLGGCTARLTDCIFSNNTFEDGGG